MIENFSVIFLSIVLEALPFVMLGAFISSIIQIYVSENTIAKILPKNKFIGLLAASLAGLVFPVCECAIIPITRRLIKKGVPLNIAVTFMLAVPIVNPVVLLSTYYAFHSKPYVVFIRGGFGLLAAITIGFLTGIMEEKKNPLKPSFIENDSICSCGFDHSYKKQKSKFLEIVQHMNMELYDIGKLLILGAFISAAFQTIVSRKYILLVGEHSIYSITAMMLFAFVLSLCSEADAFIASTFLGQFSLGGIVSFLILGPMIDIKNTLMLTASFKSRFVIKLIFLVFIICFIIGYIINAAIKIGVIQ
ncbi:permease [Clostridium sp. SYSU_GA19001]|uniref:permease n=1 Tax=Clostridium caldaquaticum TaxID=2940653 RepID=UPI00207701F0|nr:permease [Clostridium caldaquaticum]MCM8711366.1 permease [Clostridium caldaquaticum]